MFFGVDIEDFCLSFFACFFFGGGGHLGPELAYRTRVGDFQTAVYKAGVPIL